MDKEQLLPYISLAYVHYFSESAVTAKKPVLFWRLSIMDLLVILCVG